MSPFLSQCILPIAELCSPKQTCFSLCVCISPGLLVVIMLVVCDFLTAHRGTPFTTRVPAESLERVHVVVYNVLQLVVSFTNASVRQ